MEQRALRWRYSSTALALLGSVDNDSNTADEETR